jgi:hypothetical protein
MERETSTCQRPGCDKPGKPKYCSGACYREHRSKESWRAAQLKSRASRIATTEDELARFDKRTIARVYYRRGYASAHRSQDPVRFLKAVLRQVQVLLAEAESANPPAGGTRVNLNLSGL